jgi:type III restriction enzyme
MVRTPLARRIASDEFLNTVALYLPHYDEEGLDAVIARLITPDPDILPPVRVEKGENMVVLNRARRSEKAFAALAELPSYVIPRSRKTSQVRRLMKLARALAHDDIRENAPEKATDLLVRILRGEYRRAKRTKQFKVHPTKAYFDSWIPRILSLKNS